MKVRAKSQIYYGDMRRREGEVFELKTFTRKMADGSVKEFTPEMQFTEDVMERMDQDVPLRRGVKPTRSELFPPLSPRGIARAAAQPRNEDGTFAIGQFKPVEIAPFGLESKITDGDGETDADSI